MSSVFYLFFFFFLRKMKKTLTSTLSQKKKENKIQYRGFARFTAENRGVKREGKRE